MKPTTRKKNSRQRILLSPPTVSSTNDNGSSTSKRGNKRLLKVIMLLNICLMTSCFLQLQQAFDDNNSRIYGDPNQQPTETETITTTIITTTNSSLSREDTTYLWDDPKNVQSLPAWMIDYFQWHTEQRNQLIMAVSTNHSHWKNYSFLIMRCYHYEKCGGTTDRLRPLPMMLKVAYQTQRLLFIHWTNPCSLTEFLVPPQGGLNWRLPQLLVDYRGGEEKSNETTNYNLFSNELYHSSKSSYLPSNDQHILLQAQDKRKIIVQVKYQNFNYGQEFYNQNLPEKELPMLYVYREVWNICFTPTPPIAQQIHYEMHNIIPTTTTMDRLLPAFQQQPKDIQTNNHIQLIPGHYSTIHVRALYAVKWKSKQKIREMVWNAIHCLTEIDPYDTNNNKPYYFTSDSKVAYHYAMEYAHTYNVTMKIRPQEMIDYYYNTTTTNNNTKDHTTTTDDGISDAESAPHLGMVNIQNVFHTSPKKIVKTIFREDKIDPKTLYNVFADIYIIGYSQCVSFGEGGFGHWNFLLGPNSYGTGDGMKCGIVHENNVKRIQQKQCQFTTLLRSSNQTASSSSSSSSTIAIAIPTNTTTTTSYYTNTVAGKHSKWIDSDPPLPYILWSPLENYSMIPKPTFLNYPKQLTFLEPLLE